MLVFTVLVQHFLFFRAREVFEKAGHGNIDNCLKVNNNTYIFLVFYYKKSHMVSERMKSSNQ